MSDSALFPASKGLYLLLLHNQHQRHLRIGGLGQQCFPAGWWLYVGSAHGSGGLAARLRHHLNTEHPRLHWHMDYLRPHCQLRQIWTAGEDADFEHHIAGQLQQKLSTPIPGFGSSDCKCPSHLFYSPRIPELADLSFFSKGQLLCLEYEGGIP